MKVLAWLYLLLFAFGLLPASLDAAYPPVVDAGQRFTCTPVAVWDGDGPVWCAEGPKIRIAGVAAREMDGNCKTNQRCPNVDAGEARDRLVAILGGACGTPRRIKVRSAPMSCRSDGSAGDRGRRPGVARRRAPSLLEEARYAGRATGALIRVTAKARGIVIA